MSQKYDAVVIGAGNGGLCAAARAAKLGMKVLLLERHNVPGGFATSFVRGRFEFEPTLHELCDFGTPENPGEVRKIFSDLGVKDIEWVQVPEAYRIILGDESGLDATMPFGEREYVDALARYVPNSRASGKKFISLCAETLNALEYITASNGNPDEKKLREKYPNFLKSAGYSVNRVLKALDMPPQARDIVTAYWCYTGCDCDRLSFAFFAAMFLKYMRFGAAVPKMRSHEISCAFDKRIRELGGDIWYNTTATGITLKDGAVAGVHTDAGDVECSCVLCDCSPHSVYGALVDPSAVTSEIRKRLAAREFGTRGLVLYLGLNKTAEEIGLQEYGYFCYDSGDSAELAEKSRTIFNNGTQATVCLNRANPDCSPKGTCILSITTFYAQDVWGRISPRRYFEIKKGIAEKLVKDFERMTKLSITPYIEEIELATPVTLARYTGNPEGVMYGYAGNDWDNMLARMQMLSEDSRVEIPGISFVGGYGARTSGYSSTYICGNMEAKRAFAALKEEGKI